MPPTASTTNTSTRVVGASNTPSPSHAMQHALDPDAEPDARRRRAAHVLGEAVVPAAAADRVLRRVQRVARELERRARVVVEPAHEPGRDLEVDAERLQPFLHLLELRRPTRPTGTRRSAARARSCRPSPRASSRGCAAGSPPRAPSRRRAAPRGRASTRAARRGSASRTRAVAHRVDRQPVPLQPDVAVEAVRERDHLDVDRRVLDAEHLDADLPVLAVAALLRPLVAEVRRDVPDLPRQHRPVLHERPHDRRGAVGAAARGARPPLSVEVVHLLADDVGARPSFCTTSRCSKIGRDEQAEAGPAGAGPRSARRAPDHRSDSGGRTSRVPMGARKTSRPSRPSVCPCSRTAPRLPAGGYAARGLIDLGPGRDAPRRRDRVEELRRRQVLEPLVVDVVLGVPGVRRVPPLFVPTGPR